MSKNINSLTADKVDLQITITGKLPGVCNEDVEKFKNKPQEEIICILMESATDIKVDVREVYVKGGK